MVTSLTSILISHIHITQKLVGILSTSMGGIIPLYSVMCTLGKEYYIICPLFILNSSHLFFFFLPFSSDFLIQKEFLSLLFCLTFASLFAFSSSCLPTAFQEIIRFQCGGSCCQWSQGAVGGTHFIKCAHQKKSVALRKKKQQRFQVLFLY